MNASRRAALQHYGRIGGRIGGKIGGKMHVESGHIFTIANAETWAEGGRIQGRVNAETGHIHKIRTTESASRGGIAANHLRWHVRRNKRNPKRCELCANKLRNETQNNFGGTKAGAATSHRLEGSSNNA